MLKIKDNVDLKELGKFGFKYFERFEEIYKRFENGILTSINKKSRIIKNTKYYKGIIIGKNTYKKDIQDLIKAGLVEELCNQ